MWQCSGCCWVECGVCSVGCVARRWGWADVIGLTWLGVWSQVYELDREIQDYKEKIELYRAKLQEIVSISVRGWTWLVGGLVVVVNAEATRMWRDAVQGGDRVIELVEWVLGVSGGRGWRVLWLMWMVCDVWE